MKSIILFIFCFLCFVFFGQNLIFNGGFEERTCEPQDISMPLSQQLNCCKNWFNPMEQTTSDYFTTTANCPVKLPNTFRGIINPHSGNSIVGIITHFQTIENYTEYISTKLIKSLKKNYKYNLAISFAKGFTSDSITYCNWYHSTFYNNNGYSNHIGFYFSKDSIHNANDLYLDYTPQLIIDEIIVLGPTEWKTYQLSFIAEEDYQYLTIGNFFISALNSTLSYNINFPVNAYYFIDDVSLEQDLTYHPEGNIIEPNVFTPNGDGVNDFFVPVLAEHIESYELSILNRWGEQVFFSNKLNVGWDGKIGDNIGPDGVYYWNMIYKDNNGKEGIQSGYLTLLH